MASDTVLGLSLGRSSECSALAAACASGQDHEGRPVWAVPLLQRWPVGTPYPDIVNELAQTTSRLDRPVLILDVTGVGQAIADLFRQAQLPVRELLAVTVTAGQSSHRAAWDRWTCARKDLAGVVQSVLQGRRLKVARGLREAAMLMQELATFRMKATAAEGDPLESWREGSHDDLVLAVALALWKAEQGPEPEWNIIHLRRDPLAQGGPAPDVVFPQVRYFRPHASYQPMPEIDGERILACPDFRTQEEAAYFLAVFYRSLGLPGSDFAVELEVEQRHAVEKTAAAFIRQRRLAPAVSGSSAGKETSA
jgi:hypothetical protein